MPSIMSSNPPKEKLKIKHDDKFYSRLLSKESSAANPSFRVYYGGAASSVPFGWESQPGTPKNCTATATLPPLTPPPSYHFTPNNINKVKKLSLRSTLMHTILPRLTLRKPAPAPPPPMPFSLPNQTASTTYSSVGSHRRSRLSSSMSSFSSNEGEETSPTSTLCFGMRHGTTGGQQQSGMAMKTTLMSLLGHDSSHHNN